MSCNYIDATIVSNRFIDEYMAEANDAQLKIYLYLLRMMNAGRTFSISGIADAFNHTEKDVMRALKYWEKCKVLSLEYDKERGEIIDDSYFKIGVITESFKRDIVSRFSSYYHRQGQPEFNCDSVLNNL